MTCEHCSKERGRLLFAVKRFDGRAAAASIKRGLAAMKINFGVGDRVRIRREMIATMNRNASKIDWVIREGRVVRIGHYNRLTTVVWDGRESVDQWPTGALEKVP